MNHRKELIWNKFSEQFFYASLKLERNEKLWISNLFIQFLGEPTFDVQVFFTIGYRGWCMMQICVMSPRSSFTHAHVSICQSFPRRSFYCYSCPILTVDAYNDLIANFPGIFVSQHFRRIQRLTSDWNILWKFNFNQKGSRRSWDLLPCNVVADSHTSKKRVMLVIYHRRQFFGFSAKV